MRGKSAVIIRVASKFSSPAAGVRRRNLRTEAERRERKELCGWHAGRGVRAWSAPFPGWEDWVREGRLLLWEEDLEELRSGAGGGGGGKSRHERRRGARWERRGGMGWSRKMMGMVLSASTTVLADSTIRLLTANPTTDSVRTTASIRSRRPRFACCVNRACARDFCCKILKIQAQGNASGMGGSEGKGAGGAQSGAGTPA